MSTCVYTIVVLTSAGLPFTRGVAVIGDAKELCLCVPQIAANIRIEAVQRRRLSLWGSFATLLACNADLMTDCGRRHRNMGAE